MTIEQIAELLVQLSEQPLEKGGNEPLSDEMEQETDIAELDLRALHSVDKPGIPSRFSCPECHGVLWEIDDHIVRFRCRVGHAWSPESLLGEQALQLDGALWMALRGLEEKAALARELAVRARQRRSHLTALRFEEQAEEATRAATLIRTMLQSETAPARQRGDGS